MQHGIDTEDEARVAYEMATGQEVQQVGFCELSEWIGASPDGLIGEDKGLELKCPNSDTHLRYLCEGFGNDYYYQVQGNIWCSGRLSWDVVSYDSRFPEDKQLLITTIYRDPEALEGLENRINLCIAKAKEIMKI